MLRYSLTWSDDVVWSRGVSMSGASVCVRAYVEIINVLGHMHKGATHTRWRARDSCNKTNRYCKMRELIRMHCVRVSIETFGFTGHRGADGAVGRAGGDSQMV